MSTAEARALLEWYDRHRRDLPWRRTRDPYRVWLSEVMLQQTRVETAQPYYERFVERFPTVGELAAAGVDEVLALWSGLGYYRRARQLHAAARRIAAAGGELPRRAADLVRLPGIGPYTAAAVASIAFGEVEPVLDGNVERVVSRLLAFAGDPKTRPGRQELLERAAELLDPGRPGDSNQALMELGATVCTPRQPRCPLCPFEGGCRAAAGGDPERYPAPRRRRPTELRPRLAAVVREEGGGRVLLFRRPEGAELLAGTWELPWVEAVDGASGGGDGIDLAAARRALAGRYGGRWRLGRRLGEVRHGITFRDLRFTVFEGRLSAADGVAEGPEAGWFDAEGRRRLPQSSWIGKALALAEKGAPAS